MTQDVEKSRTADATTEPEEDAIIVMPDEVRIIRDRIVRIIDGVNEISSLHAEAIADEIIDVIARMKD